MSNLKKNEAQKARGWGTILDYKEKIPVQYIGKSFIEPWHDELEKFRELSNDEKWEMGYWIERQAYKYGGKIGILMGIIVGIFLTVIVTLITINNI